MHSHMRNHPRQIIVSVHVIERETGKEAAENKDMTEEVSASGTLHLRSEFIGDEIREMYERCNALLNGGNR